MDEKIEDAEPRLDPNRVQEMTELQKEIKSKITKELELEVDDEDFQLETPLFDHEFGLGLDSLESLEIVSVFSNDYNISFDDAVRDDFISVKTLSDFILGQQNLEEK
jgi:acyl carrier protein